MALVFCDTSVLLAAIHEPHERHARSLAVVRPLTKKTGACALHTLAEMYATLGHLPTAGPRPRPADVRAAVHDVTKVLSPVGLTPEDYTVVLDRLADRNIAGPKLYDALILRCAEKVQASVIYTWNLKDFHAVAPPELLPRIREPA